MADEHRGGRGPPPPRDQQQDDSQYADEEDRRSSYQLPPPNSSGVTLPSIHEAHMPYGAPPPGRGYAAPPQDPMSRGAYSASPTGHNGYGPPPPPSSNGYLPPVHHPSHDPRAYNSDYYSRGPPPPGYPHDPYQPYSAGYRPPPGPPGAYAPYTDYRGGPAAQAQPQAAPRQRTSIACRYCRKRKIRCSGYQNTTNGKCTNCDKLRIDCVFQPVSSNSSTAFVPISAVPGGVPPGTQLFGAYGQPLPASGGPPPPPGPYGHSPVDYHHPMASPTSAYPPQYYDDRDPHRRRPRGPEDDPGIRLPPPNPYQNDDPQRRSPASNQSSSTPPTSYNQYPQPGQGYEGERDTTPRRNSPGSAQSAAPSNSSSNPMSLSSLVDQHSNKRASDQGRDMDQNMLGKLGRRP